MPRILVADDDVAQVTVQRSLLEALGYDVDTALSPSETLRKLERQPPGLIVVDLGFPDTCDGLALIRDIRETGCLAPLIVLSGWPEDLYGTPEEEMVTRVVVKGSVRELLRVIAELLAVPPISETGYETPKLRIG